jgi:hypothetical protein
MILNLVHTVGDIVLSINGPRQPNESQVDEANRISGPGTDCVHSRSLQGPSEFGDFVSQLGEPPRHLIFALRGRACTLWGCPCSMAGDARRLR